MFFLILVVVCSFLNGCCRLMMAQTWIVCYEFLNWSSKAVFLYHSLPMNLLTPTLLRWTFVTIPCFRKIIFISFFFNSILGTVCKILSKYFVYCRCITNLLSINFNHKCFKWIPRVIYCSNEFFVILVDAYMHDCKVSAEAYKITTQMFCSCSVHMKYEDVASGFLTC